MEEKKNNFLNIMDNKAALMFALQCLDLTSLNGTDNENDIILLCEKAEKMYAKPASVCIYPAFCKTAKEQLKHTDIKIACVAGGFPSGQLPVHLKINEVKYAISEGADEIDMVISRGKFLAGDYSDVYDEIAAIKSICGNAILKVILETGELKTEENIYKASEIAIKAGADFIKTSTGKSSVHATPESFKTMLLAIKKHYENSGQIIGIKPAGGIKDIETAFIYINILYETLGEKWMNKKHFRIGASSLADKLIDQLHIL
ncbi:MAG: deoxyribose-phosphate aldolase [Bacteroidales bacterium]|nr:deoxyribose-phosphate aldolase [Bacteroidales bacterium]